MITLKLVTEANALSSEEQAAVLAMHKEFLLERREHLKLKPEVPNVAIGTLLRGTACLIALRDNVPVGYTMFRNQQNDFSIRCLYVRAEHRMQGIMTHMLNDLLSKERFHCGTCNVPVNTPHIRDFLTGRGWKLELLNNWWCFTTRQLTPLAMA